MAGVLESVDNLLVKVAGNVKFGSFISDWKIWIIDECDLKKQKQNIQFGDFPARHV